MPWRRRVAEQSAFIDRPHALCGSSLPGEGGCSDYSGLFSIQNDNAVLIRKYDIAGMYDDPAARYRQIQGAADIGNARSDR